MADLICGSLRSWIHNAQSAPPRLHRYVGSVRATREMPQAGEKEVHGIPDRVEQFAEDTEGEDVPQGPVILALGRDG